MVYNKQLKSQADGQARSIRGGQPSPPHGNERISSEERGFILDER